MKVSTTKLQDEHTLPLEKQTRLALSDWFDTFVENKGISLEQCFEVQGQWGFNIMHYQNVIDSIKLAPVNEMRAIAKQLIILDFKDQDIKGYLRHLAQAIAI